METPSEVRSFKDAFDNPEDGGRFGVLLRLCVSRWRDDLSAFEAMSLANILCCQIEINGKKEKK